MYSSALLLLTFVGQSLAEERVRFARDVLPILSDNCFQCHGPDEKARKAGLRLDLREGALSKAKSGESAIVEGASQNSELMRRLTTTDPESVMPPPKTNRKLSATQIETLRLWIDQGATWGKHWSLEPPVRPKVPTNHAIGTNALDAFLHERLAEEGLRPAAEAPPATLIRRTTLDLNGFPPSPEETQAYLADSHPNRHERLLDRLLASPRFGERMAWDWLEAARYADSNGYQGDNERTMWPWRDWVVDALNANLPFDEFTRYQIAGDLLPGATPEQKLATGFLRNHMINGEGGRIPEENRIDYLFDQTETVGTVWLGATFNCTRCHDHKYDPFTQKDYFSLLAFFNQTAVDGSGGNAQTPPTLAVPSAMQTKRLAEATERLEAAIAAAEASSPRSAKDLPKEILDLQKTASRKRDATALGKLVAFWKDKDETYAGLLLGQKQAQEERNAVEQSIPRVMVMEDLAKQRSTYILSRGSYLSPGKDVSMSAPASFLGTDQANFRNRFDLANWLVSPDHPLTARVTVNRYWQAFFGVGLVKTSEDFGVQGERPFHPELLDWLAREFVDSGWDAKRLIRLMLSSASYRQSSKVSAQLFERDPENRLLARGPRHRLPSWMIRDAALAVSGLLVEQGGGPSVKPYQPPGVWEEATFGGKRYQQDHGAALYRRSLYVFWRRIIGPTMFFDVASRQTCTVKTPRTNVPLHALLTMNDLTYVEAARVLAEQLMRDAGTEKERLVLASQKVLGRAPTSQEEVIFLRGLQRHRERFAGDTDEARKLLAVGEWPFHEKLDAVELAAWTMLCNTLLNLDEALSKE